MTPDDPIADPLPQDARTERTVDRVVARVEGTRPCLRCGHDLHGQSIVVESEHGLLIARCSECGTVAAMSEYPVLGVWGRRLGAALMTVMLGLLIPLALLSALVVLGVSTVMFDQRIDDARLVLESMVGLGNQVPPEWWQANRSEARARMLEAFFDFDGRDVMLAVALSPLPVLLGILWSAMLPGLPRRRTWVVAPVIGVVAMAYLAIGLIGSDPVGVVPVWTYPVSMQVAAWPGLASFIAVATVLMTIGLFLGRTILRALASFALPPRHRRLVSFLWTVDGLDPPRGRG